MVFSSTPCRSGEVLVLALIVPCNCLQQPDCLLDAHATSSLQLVQVLANRLDFRSAENRLSFLLSLVQAYRLLARVGIYTSFGPSIPVYTCIYTDTRIYGLNTYDD